MYLVGFTPWDTDTVPPELQEMVEGDPPPPPGRALDLGCGTGTQAVYLAGRGWDVTGVDAVAKPLRRARVRAQAAGVTVHWVRGDVAALDQAGLRPGFDLVFDRGCFHGLRPDERASYAVAVTGVTRPGARLLMMAFAPNDVRVGPAGTDEPELVRLFEDWDVTASPADTGPGPAGPLRDVPRRWYHLTRRG